MTSRLIKSIFIFLIFSIAVPAYCFPPEHVVLLHGLARTSNSMKSLENYLKDHGYQVLNIDYPSRKYQVSELANMIRKEVIAKTADAKKIHFITHSMGGIVLRYIQKENSLPNLGRVVMLSPPNQGSEVVDKLKNFRLFEWINGPAGKQLGTDKNSMCQKLGKASFELGVITGDISINWINSYLIPGKDDGKVSVESAKIEGMADFLVVHATHPLIMNDKSVMKQCAYFLREGTFKRN